MKTNESELVVPPAELIDTETLRVDGDNPNKMSIRRFEALKKSIQRWGFVVPIITNKDFLVADGEHRLRAAKDLGLKQVSVVRLPVDDVDRRLLRQVMNKIRGEHDLYLDAEEYYRLVCEDQRDLLKQFLNESDLRINNLLKLREPFEVNDEELKILANQFSSRVESNRLAEQEQDVSSGEALTLRCHVEFSTKAEVTKRTIAVCEAFGLGVDEAKHFVIFDNFSLDFQRGNLIFITGDSGGGKTLLLSAFKKFFGKEAVTLSDLEIDPEETLVEGVGVDVSEAIRILSFCGLNDAFLFLRKFKELSDGQKYRYRIAKLMDQKEKSVWLLDEFCATLDPVMARIISYLLQKVARKLGKTVAVATTHNHLEEDFQPDILIEKGFENDVKLTHNDFSPNLCSIYDKISIEKSNLEDYSKLSRFHYRTKENETGSLRVKDCYKLLFGDKLIGVIVYSHSFLNLKPRNLVFGQRYVFTPGDLHKAQLINEEITRISRVIIHPKFRGIGLGAYLVKETMLKVNAKVVEVLAIMAMYNPFFEKAGMLKFPYKRDRPSEEKKIRQFLERLNFDFDFGRSKTYCNSFYSQLTKQNKKKLLDFLTDYAHQPFIKIRRITPGLLSNVFPSETTYLYLINKNR